MDSLLQDLKGKLSSQAAILTAKDEGFDGAVSRWTDLGRKVPSAVVQPTNESDVVATVKEATKSGIPFVAASGGHSQWSTIDKQGFVLDFQRFKKIDVDTSNKTATVSGGLLMKELQVALSEKKLFTGIANGNTIGVIPYFLGGGIGSYSPYVGFACENILSARIVDGSGTIVEASETQNQDVLWAIRGAGQFLGVVTQLTLRAYDLALMPNGHPQVGVILFPTAKAAAVINAIKQITSTSPHASAGLVMITNNPQGPGRVLMVSPQFFGTDEQYKETFKPLIDLGPFKNMQHPGSFEKHTDHLGWLMAKGGHKRFSYTGTAELDADAFAQIVDLHETLQKELPGTERSSFQYEWHTPIAKDAEAYRTETAFGNKGVDTWLNVNIQYGDESQLDKVLEFERKAQAIVRKGASPDSFITYTNTNRDDPVEYRYKGDALKKLQAVKAKLDPEGVFSKEFLSSKL